MSTATRKVNNLYEVRGALRLLASPFADAGRVYVQGVRNAIHGTRRLIGREPRVVDKVERPRPLRNYDIVALTKARDLFAAAKPFVDVIKQLGVSESDSTLLAHVRATA